jgi:hypothetical protein
VEAGGAEDVGVVDVGAGVEAGAGVDVGGGVEDGRGMQALGDEASLRLRLAKASCPRT